MLTIELSEKVAEAAVFGLEASGVNTRPDSADRMEQAGTARARELELRVISTQAGLNYRS